MNKLLSTLLLFIFSLGTFAKDTSVDNEYLKVCADPYMLPFSNQKKEGYENRIAELFGKKLGKPVRYEFFPQRMGFIRNTLKAEAENGSGYKCDLVMSVPGDFELAATTKPYFTSIYVLVYAKGRKLDAVTDPSMLDKFVNEGGNKIRLGLSDRGPAQVWVYRNNLIGAVTPYQAQPGDPKANPGKRFIDDIVADKIDAAIVWGPTAGYYAQQVSKDGTELVLLPLSDDPDQPQMRFTYSFAMAVRYGENEWKETINKMIDENQQEIEAILESYGVPLIK